MKIEVRVKAGARRDNVEIVEPESRGKTPLYIVALKAPAKDGKANAALIKLLSKHFGVPRAAITIKRGTTSKHKLVQVTS
jgi:hypothetical protein